MSKTYWLSFPFDFFQPLMPYLVNFGFFTGCFLVHENCQDTIINDPCLSFHQMLTCMPSVNIFKQLVKMFELNQLFMLFSQEDFLLIAAKFRTYFYVSNVKGIL